MILIGLGANLDSQYGVPEQTLTACAHFLLEKNIKIIKSSNVWRSAPVPISDQPWYYNAVCEVQTDLDPDALLAVLADIEDQTGRERKESNEARVLDLDLLSYNGLTIATDELTIPHLRMHERAFVLCPLNEIAPNWLHPTLDKTVTEMIKAMPEGQEIEQIEDSYFLCVA